MSSDQFQPDLADIDSAPESLYTYVPELYSVTTPDASLQEDLRRLSDQISAKDDLIIELRRKLATKTILDSLLEPMSKRSFSFMYYYCGGVGLIMLLHGFHFHFALPDSVLNFLAGSTAVTVIGLVGMVLTGIFVGARK